MPTNTIKQLAAITDAAQFERIATSVLRSAAPLVYANLSHPGVNTDGKTVKAPLDNVGWVRMSGEDMLVAAAHTTAGRDDLEGKWLHDPTTVTPRGRSGRPTQPSGDLIKAISELKKFRVTAPGLKATLALTCNREEPAEVRVKAEALATAEAVNLDIWSVSRLAQYLDTTAEGQAIRQTYLGTPVVLLSKSELLRAGRLSLYARTCPTDTTPMVDRSVPISGTGHVILSGASGMGKTTLCLAFLRTSLASGQPGLVLSDQTLRDATSIEEAIEMELRRYLPYLEPLAGLRALDLCSELVPLNIVIEDISRAENSVGLLNKVVAWTLHSISKESNKSPRTWRMLCPVWPRFLSAIDKIKEVYAAGIIQPIGLYSEKEALEAVKSRGNVLKKPQSDMSALATAQALGRDPLLIGLYEFTGIGQAQDVIAEYISHELARIAIASGLMESDLERITEQFGFQMLQRKCIAPCWNDAVSWFDSAEDRQSLRLIVSKGSILRLARIDGKEVIEPRHDRVLHSLLAASIAARLDVDMKDSFLSDPYFAEYVGTAVVKVKLLSTDLQALMQESPLISFFALKDALSRKSDYADIVAEVIKAWLSLTGTQASEFFSRRIRALSLLSDIESSIVLELTDKFPAFDHRDAFFEARFRNGDLTAALNWLTQYPFGTTVGGRQELVDHLHIRWGDRLTRSVANVLESDNLQSRALLGALYLAGYIGDPTLAHAVRTAWNNTGPDGRDLVAFLWAAARVCGAEAASTLGPVCDAWAALPEPDDDRSVGLSRSSLAAYGLSWKFRDHPPSAALPYFVKRAESEELRWPITYMLRCIDDPVAVQHEVEYLADLDHKFADQSGIRAHFVMDEWERQSREHGHSMSMMSKTRLLDLALDIGNSNYLRKRAFSLWEVSVAYDDVAIARSIGPGNILHDTAVWARARRQDVSVIPELIVKLKSQSAGYWWQTGRYMWAEEFTVLLDESI